LPVEEVGDEAVDRLIVEPLLAAKYIPQSDANVIDVGSGGGSPAIPMKIAAPEIAMTMVESKTRKAAFLREAVRAVNLQRTTVNGSRFEALELVPAMRETFDLVTLRAVRIDTKVGKVASSLLKPCGRLWLFNSQGTHESTVHPQLSHIARHMLLEGRSVLDVFERTS
jgi:16S rRNA (guanine527-N7)-methyltransferase